MSPAKKVTNLVKLALHMSQSVIAATFPSKRRPKAMTETAKVKTKTETRILVMMGSLFFLKCSQSCLTKYCYQFFLKYLREIERNWSENTYFVVWVAPHIVKYLKPTQIYLTFFRLVASDCVPRWRQEATYLRFLHGFVQSSPQLILQCVIILRGVHIHSLEQTVEAVQLALKDNKASVLEYVINLISTKPIKWYWGLIQVRY
jgi:hypothetical protein